MCRECDRAESERIECADTLHYALDALVRAHTRGEGVDATLIRDVATAYKAHEDAKNVAYATWKARHA